MWFVLTLLVVGGCLLPSVRCQEKFSNMFIHSMKKLKAKSQHFNLNFTEWGILDVGANSGDWSDMMRKQIFPSSDYFLIEGNSHYENLLTTKGYRFEIALVGDIENQIVEFQYHSLYPTGGTFLPEKIDKTAKGFHTKKLSMTTIDSVLARNNVKPPQFMKMDIQGAEFLALRGAVKTLRTVEILVIEVAIHQYNAGAASFADINLYLESQGFRLYDIGDLRNTKVTYKGQGGGLNRFLPTLLQADFMWAKANSPYFTEAGFPDPPSSKYKCEYIPPK